MNDSAGKQTIYRDPKITHPAVL